MAKDPAFLFYPGDWLGGTIAFSRYEKGCYIDLLIGQFNEGHMEASTVMSILGEKDFRDYWAKKLKKKFKVDKEGRFYNERLDVEVMKRRNHCEHQRINIMKRWEKSKDKSYHGITTVNTTVIPLENENENENENTIGIETKYRNGKRIKMFVPPKVEEVFSVMKGQGLSLSAANKEAGKFINYYESNGWKVGKNKMKDWAAAARGWAGRNETMQEKSVTMSFKEAYDHIEKYGDIKPSDITKTKTNE